MPKYKLGANRCFYHSIYYYLNYPYGDKRKVLKVREPNKLMCTGLSFGISFHNNTTNRIPKTAKNC